MSKIGELISKLRKGNSRALARTISLIEDGTDISSQIVQELYPYTGNAYVIGVTGSPGAGKSTLVDQLTKVLTEEGKKVAILAIDPSSPFSGGALLGDRVRMNNAASSTEVFIRSMASRGNLGGLAPYTHQAMFALDAAGFDYIIIETVGVGQAEVEIVKTSDTVLVVLVPGMGDSVQALKAGIMEIADTFVINKADYDGADRLKKELVGLLSLAEGAEWKPKIVKTISTEGKGVSELFEKVVEHRAWAEKSGANKARRKLFLMESLKRMLSRRLLEDVLEFADSKRLVDQAIDNLVARKTDPVTVCQDIITQYKNK